MTRTTAFLRGEKTLFSWEQVSEKISSLLERGEYCEQDIIDRAADNEFADAAAELRFLHQDFSEEYWNKNIIPYTGIFPDNIAVSENSEKAVSKLDEPRTEQKNDEPKSEQKAISLL